MTIAVQIIHREIERNKRMILAYENELSKLPKGKIIEKKINAHSYFYLKFRNGEKVITKYIGKKEVDLSLILEQLEKRKHVEAMIKQLEAERKELNRIGGLI